MLQQGAVPVEQALAPHLGQAGGRVLFQTGEEAVACLLELLPLGGEIQLALPEAVVLVPLS